RCLLPSERPADLGDADILILGMGRIGSGAYDYLGRHYPGRIVGVEESADKAQQMRGEGLRCVAGDASDRDFLERSALARRQVILVCLSNHSENVQVVKMLQSLGYNGKIAAISRFPDQQRELQAMGCISFNLYAEAGYGFAERVLEELEIATR
ncbi:MAG: NAD(P)-binding protein, partial [Pseudomonadota bacterium]|nr:NAD(P)-binding protein [Pseudomonadota bacterium]